MYDGIVIIHNAERRCVVDHRGDVTARMQNQPPPNVAARERTRQRFEVLAELLRIRPRNRAPLPPKRGYFTRAERTQFS